MTYYIGTSPTDVINGFIKRYMYGLRRNDDGELFLVKIDQLSGGDENIAIINDIGIAAENYLDFEEGIDYLAGISYVYPQNISSPAYGDGPDSNVIITNTKPSEGY
jgi:hypothetical protein